MSSLRFSWPYASATLWVTSRRLHWIVWSQVDGYIPRGNATTRPLTNGQVRSLTTDCTQPSHRYPSVEPPTVATACTDCCSIMRHVWIAVCCRIGTVYCTDCCSIMRHVWSAVCCRIGTVYCTDCCSICAKSGVQFAAESEQFTVHGTG